VLSTTEEEVQSGEVKPASLPIWIGTDVRYHTTKRFVPRETKV